MACTRSTTLTFCKIYLTLSGVLGIVFAAFLFYLGIAPLVAMVQTQQYGPAGIVVVVGTAAAVGDVGVAAKHALTLSIAALVRRCARGAGDGDHHAGLERSPPVPHLLAHRAGAAPCTPAPCLRRAERRARLLSAAAPAHPLHPALQALAHAVCGSLLSITVFIILYGSALTIRSSLLASDNTGNFDATCNVCKSLLSSVLACDCPQNTPRAVEGTCIAAMEAFLKQWYSIVGSIYLAAQVRPRAAPLLGREPTHAHPPPTGVLVAAGR